MISVVIKSIICYNTPTVILNLIIFTLFSYAATPTSLVMTVLDNYRLSLDVELQLNIGR